MADYKSIHGVRVVGYTADPDDIIIVGDLDEIPNLEDINFDNIKNKLIFFKQKMLRVNA